MTSLLAPLLAAFGTVTGVAGASTTAPTTGEITPGPGVTASMQLSAYAPWLAGTPGDTAVYVLEGASPGSTVVVVGGTHANEIAGVMTAVLLVERAVVRRGRLIVVPHANNPAATVADDRHPGPPFISLLTPSGQRRFRYGSRRTPVAAQGSPDPPVFVHPSSPVERPGEEARNLDRAYPGRSDGNLTERIAAGVMALLTRERVDVAFDLHEAGPDSRLAWMLVANPRSVDIAATAIVALDERGIPMKLEPSSETFRGLSHREWGDATGAQTFLIETPNPGQGEEDTAFDVVNDPRYPLARRVAVQLATVTEVLRAYESTAGRAPFVLEGLPSFDELSGRGLGAFLQ